MLTNVVKFWSRVHSGQVDAWGSGLGHLWDAAIRGSSALRAALWRSLLDEEAVLAGAQVAVLLLDIEKLTIR
eukprot:5494814-Pyramimonas_sp.AAC.1